MTHASPAVEKSSLDWPTDDAQPPTPPCPHDAPDCRALDKELADFIVDDLCGTAALRTQDRIVSQDGQRATEPLVRALDAENARAFAIDTLVVLGQDYALHAWCLAHEDKACVLAAAAIRRRQARRPFVTGRWVGTYGYPERTIELTLTETDHAVKGTACFAGASVCQPVTGDLWGSRLDLGTSDERGHPLRLVAIIEWFDAGAYGEVRTPRGSYVGTVELARIPPPPEAD